MRPRVDLEKQWSEICRTLTEQLRYLEEGRMMYPIEGDPRQFTNDFVVHLREEIAAFETLLSNFRYATFREEAVSSAASHANPSASGLATAQYPSA